MFICLTVHWSFQVAVVRPSLDVLRWDHPPPDAASPGEGQPFDFKDSRRVLLHLQDDVDSLLLLFHKICTRLYRSNLSNLAKLRRKCFLAICLEMFAFF